MSTLELTADAPASSLSREQTAERLLRYQTLIAAVMVVPTIIVESSSTGPALRETGVLCDWAIWLVFVVELAVMLALSADRREYLRTHPLNVAIVVLTPPVGVPSALQALRALRLFRLLRLLRVYRLNDLGRRVFTLQGLQYAALLAVIVVFTGGVGFALLEPHVSDWSGIWWALTTMTTVGDNSVGPTNLAAHILAVGLMVVGIGLASMLTGAVAQRFLASASSQADTEASLLTELQAIARRLEVIEDHLGRHGGAGSTPSND